MGRKSEMSPAAYRHKVEYNLEYAKTNKKRIPLDVQKTYYENVLQLAANKAGEPINTFIKKAIAQRIERENLGGSEDDVR